MTRAADFWTRRKADVRAEQEAEAAFELREAELHEAARLEDMSDEELLGELGLPDPDALKTGDDFSAFMARAVPERLRRRALRRLWATNPVLANLDGLVDYGEDFSDNAMVLDTLQTSYQVGKGMLAHVEEMARQAEASAAADGGPEEEADDDMAPAEAPAAEAPEVAVATSDVPVRDALDAGSPESQAAPRRRMRFDFESEDRAEV